MKSRHLEHKIYTDRDKTTKKTQMSHCCSGAEHIVIWDEPKLGNMGNKCLAFMKTTRNVRMEIMNYEITAGP